MSFGTTAGQAASRTGEQGTIPALGQGVSNLGTSANFFNTLLGGNRTNTMQLLQPDITRLKEQQQGALQGVSTLMPRGGGRFATLFQQPFAVNRQLGDLFAGMRSGAAGGLAGIGGQQAGIGQAAASNLFNQDLAKQQMLNQFLGQIIQGGEQGAGAFAGGKSDRRLKRNIKKIASTGPVDVYEYTFIGDDRIYKGVIAQDVWRVFPSAVLVGGEDPHIDPWCVDYNRLARLLGDPEFTKLLPEFMNNPQREEVVKCR